MTCERTLIYAQSTLWSALQNLRVTLWNSGYGMSVYEITAKFKRFNALWFVGYKGRTLGVASLGSATRILDWRIFIDTTTSMLYTKPTSKSQTNNSYDYEIFIIVIILNNVSVCRSKTWYMVTDMISKFIAGSAGDSILMNNSMHENFNLNYS